MSAHRDSTAASTITVPPLAAAAMLVVVLLVAWLDGVRHMLGVWQSSAFYTYSYFIVPTSAALIALGWRRGETFAPWPLAFTGLVGGALLYATGAAVELRLFQHAGIAVSIISVLAGTLGHSFSLHHRFALLFLLFMVPIGDGLLPILQQMTARGIMLVIGPFNVPAVRFDTLIRTEAGDFEVIEACAGLKLLVATIVSGAVFSHLVYSGRRKQALFMVAATIVPVIANILRASGTVLIGTWSDMQIGAHGGHIFYGMVLYLIVVALLFGIGYLWADDDAPVRPDPPLANSAAISLPILIAPAAIFIIAGLF
ncbi:exosortase/archaeosortase family protein [Parvularcula sp. LCG005]|uniref:exosortase/archaeosortase family protein n=1 Tax=Parvularcula sp. LCG005 TaxID=3078805 RepID=UPI0029439C51|nr:exosortase/archaeosortase family protein [Parvularcula sp. LCG005]WOI52044.1 exosortase/archaeosortase family protein [Parvularcula sp. LCG005]